jgi:hypothetical protein
MRTFFCMVALVASAATAAQEPAFKVQGACPATVAVDQALCEQPGLRILRDALAREWEIWQRHCSGSVTRPEIVPHAPWLAEVWMGFDRLKGVTAPDYLGSTFTRRADELA